jgi:predicted regulator of amino acid metabolism with ACT domain
MDAIMDLMDLNHKFEEFPAQRKILKIILESGISIRDKKFYCNDIEISYAAIAKVCETDQRVVKKLAENIAGDKVLRNIFKKLKSTVNLKDVASELGFGTLVIVPFNAREPGILASVSKIISSYNISIRQAIVDDSELFEEPKLYIITESPVPPKIIPELKKIKSIRSITIF